MYKQRVTNLQKKLSEKNLDAILASSHANIVYLTGFANFSTEEREAFIIITRKNVYLITDARYTEAVALHIPHATIIEKTMTNPLAKVVEILAKKQKLFRVGFEANDITVTEYNIFRKYFKLLSSDLVAQMRMIKSADEIEKIRAACKLGDTTFDYIIKELTVGNTEKQIAHKIMSFIRNNNAEISFRPIVCFGETSSDIHHQPTDKKLEKNSFVLLDFGTKVNNYCSDMTRTLFFGKANQKQKSMYLTVLNAQKKAIETLSSFKTQASNPSGADIDSVTRQYIKDHNFPPYPHGLGHGTGLQVHELPSLSPAGKIKLEQGMVFSIEPGVYIPGFGGVRIEDLVTITGKNVEILTKSPKELMEI